MGAENLAKFGVPAFVYFLNLKNGLLLTLVNIILSSVIAIAYLSSAYGAFIANSNNLYNLAKSKNIFAHSILSKMSIKNDRPINAILLKGVLIFGILSLISDKIILTSICNAGIITSFLLVFTSLLFVQIKMKDYKNMPTTILAYLSSSVLIYYNWKNMGPDNITRIKYALPILIIFALGFIMFKINKKRKSN